MNVMDEISPYIKMGVLQDVIYIKNGIWRFYKICN